MTRLLFWIERVFLDHFPFRSLFGAPGWPRALYVCWTVYRISEAVLGGLPRSGDVTQPSLETTRRKAYSARRDRGYDLGGPSAWHTVTSLNLGRCNRALTSSSLTHSTSRVNLCIQPHDTCFLECYRITVPAGRLIKDEERDNEKRYVDFAITLINYVSY